MADIRYKCPHAPQGTRQSHKTYKAILARVMLSGDAEKIRLSNLGILSKRDAYGFHPTRGTW